MQTDRRSHAVGRRLLLVGAPLLGLLPLWSLQPVYTSASLGVGLAAFEPQREGIALRYGDRMSEDMLPLSVNLLGDDIFVAVGTTAVVPLADGANLSVRSSAPGRSPWTVIGIHGPDVEPGTAPGVQMSAGVAIGRSDPARSGHRLLGGQTLSVNAGALSFQPWDEDAVWATDEARLQRMHTECAGQGDAVRLRRVARTVHAEIGKCSAAWEVGSTEESPDVRVAVAGEVAGAVFSVSGARLANETRFKPVPFAIFVTLFLFQLLAFGRVASACIGVIAFLFACWSASMAALVWIQIGIIAVVVVVARGLWSAARWVHRRTGGPLWWPAVGSALLLLTTMVTGVIALDRFFTTQLRTMFAHGTAPVAARTVLFMGYSAAESVSLPDPAFGAAAYLANVCPASLHQTATWTHIGATFSWLADGLCSDKVPAEARKVVFFGGANDDLSGPKPLMMLITHHASMVWLRLAPPGSSLGAAAFEASGRRQLANADVQAEDLSRAQACLQSRGARLFYFNDFLVTDMQAGRGEARAGLLQVRRRAVEHGGGIFVDLWEAFAEQAGVTWFNDFIHPSAVGHQQIGRLMCSVLSEPVPPTL